MPGQRDLFERIDFTVPPECADWKTAEQTAKRLFAVVQELRTMEFAVLFHDPDYRDTGAMRYFGSETDLGIHLMNDAGKMRGFSVYNYQPLDDSFDIAPYRQRIADALPHIRKG